MEKIIRKPAAVLAPVPVVMVSCEAPGLGRSIITIAWIGTVCSEPPMVGIGIRPERHSHAIISESREFVVNIPNRSLLKAVDFCGIHSGKNVDKFREAGLTAEPAKLVKAPMIKEAPVNIECRVKQVITLGVHDLFIGEILQVHQAENLFNDRENIDLQAMEAIVYGNGTYYQVGEDLNNYGFSRKKV